MNEGIAKAKFLGNEEDPGTKIMGIRHGKKYAILIKRCGFFRWFFYDQAVMIRLREGGRWWWIPYKDERLFKKNWRIL